MSDWERDEWRSALRTEPTKPGDCYRHQINSRGICSGCGMTVDKDEP